VGAFPQRRGGPHTELQHEDKTPGMNLTHVQGHIPLQAEDKELGLVRRSETQITRAVNREGKK